MTVLTENDLFELKQKFLQNIPHPKLIVKQLKRLDPHFKQDEATVLSDLELNEFLGEYMQELLELKLKLSNSKTSEEILKQLSSILNLQNELIVKLASYMTFEEQEDFNEIKQSESFDTYAFQKELTAETIEENQIKGYLCGQLNSAQKTPFFQGVVRAWKIEQHGR